MYNNTILFAYYLFYCYHDTIYGKTFEWENFAVVHKIHYSLENFRGASGRGHHVLYTASDSRENFRDRLKTETVSHSKVLPYTVTHY